MTRGRNWTKDRERHIAAEVGRSNRVMAAADDADPALGPLCEVCAGVVRKDNVTRARRGLVHTDIEDCLWDDTADRAWVAEQRAKMGVT